MGKTLLSAKEITAYLLDRALRSTAEASFNAEACMNAEGPSLNGEGNTHSSINAQGLPTTPRPDAKRNLAAAIIRETIAGGEEWLPVMQSIKHGEGTLKLGKERKMIRWKENLMSTEDRTELVID